MAGTGPRFVLLVLPLLALLLVWHLGWAAVLGRRGAPPWLRAVVGAVLVAWPIATTLPSGVDAVDARCVGGSRACRGRAGT